MGVFAGHQFSKGDIIEECEVIFFPKKEVSAMRKTQLEYYFYWWWGGAAVLPLGFGVIYHHSLSPNAEWTFDRRARRMILKALRSIRKKEEIVFDYAVGAADMWFKTID